MSATYNQIIHKKIHRDTKRGGGEKEKERIKQTES